MKGNLPGLSAKNRPLTGVLLLVWLPMLIGLWTVGICLATRHLDQWQGTGTDSRVFSMALVLFLISLLSYFPILLLMSFFGSERGRAEESQLTAIRHQGWTTFESEVRDWYRSVFLADRYPIPATLTLLTFLIGWCFAFFHAGPALIADLANNRAPLTLIQVVADGPAVLFGYLGAYFFSVWYLLRRYMSGDLGPGVFVHLTVRTWAVIILTLVVSVAYQGVPFHAPAKSDSDKVLIAVAFLGGITPSFMVSLIVDTAKGVLGNRAKSPYDVTDLTTLQGIDTWRSARLSEEGVDNVQNLAMEDPARLVVVTQEGSLRVLDWIDQALLRTYVPTDEVFKSLRERGIRTAFDLYLAFHTRDLITRSTADANGVVNYTVKEIADNGLGSNLDAQLMRQVVLGIIHHPNFRKIRQMRERASKAADELFVTLATAVSTPMPQRGPTPVQAADAIVESAPLSAKGARQRPARGGCSIGHVKGTSATMGCLVRGNKAPHPTYILSTSQIVPANANAGDPILQPGPADGGTVPDDTIATLSLWMTPQKDNIDAALALVLDDTIVSPDIGDLGRPTGIALPEEGMIVRKVGRSGVSSTVIIDVGADVKIQGYGSGDDEVWLSDLILCADAALPGDSGAILLDSDNRAVGLLIAGSQTHTIYQPIQRILAALNVSLVTEG